METFLSDLVTVTVLLYVIVTVKVYFPELRHSHCCLYFLVLVYAFFCKLVIIKRHLNFRVFTKTT